MKRLMAMAALALAQAGCVANQGDAAVRFLDARALTFEEGVGCTPSDEFVIGSGSLDLSGGGGNYLLAMSVETNNSVQSITINQEEFAGQGLSDITLNELVYSYEFLPNGSTDAANLIDTEEESAAIYRVLRPGTSAEETYVFIYAFGPKGAAALSGKNGIVFSTIKARGRLSGGQVVESNKFTFPVRVYSSGANYDCSAVPDTKPAGVCVTGQDVPVLRPTDPACVDAS